MHEMNFFHNIPVFNTAEPDLENPHLSVLKANQIRAWTHSVNNWSPEQTRKLNAMYA
jgi:hypothetical protein